MEMPQYKCHKVVKASPITKFNVIDSDGGCLIQVECDPGNDHLFGSGLYARYTPEAGDYLVEYDNSYVSVSPKSAFEGGYQLLSELPKSVSPARLEEVIASEKYFIDGMMTICSLTLQNGFNVVGTGACANPEIYCPEKGKQFAREDAVRQVWQLEGYALKQAMHGRNG